MEGGNRNYDRRGGRASKFPPPPIFDGQAGDNVKMFIKQFELFAGGKKYEFGDYYMHATKYLGAKVKVMMNRWSIEALEDWKRVRNYLIKTFDNKNSKHQSIKEFEMKVHLPTENYREHMHNLQSLKMTGWPEEYDYCRSDDIKEPFNSSLVDQFLRTCRTRAIADKVENLIAEKTAMNAKLSVENIIDYCEMLSNTRHGNNFSTPKVFHENCKICGNGRHTTKECSQFKKMHAILNDERSCS